MLPFLDFFKERNFYDNKLLFSTHSQSTSQLMYLNFSGSITGKLATKILFRFIDTQFLKNPQKCERFF